MGGCASTPTILEKNDGDQAAYAARFKEDRVLGEGEFGQVKLVYEKQQNEAEAPMKGYACKILRKGAVFKDNTLYPPIPPDVLMGEIDMLRTLNGEYYCMKLIAIYETPRTLLMVTDYYTGGEMMEYISKQSNDLRTEDISRFSYQLLSAVNHCSKNNIIHRDIKPENVMFESESNDADMRLIDFGCSTNKIMTDNNVHTTFAGTPFYDSPEMFQKKYTNKTDVWSSGVLLYVLVAGYPSDNLQRAFNKLLDNKRKSTKELTNIPQDMPESYYEMLDSLLTYKYNDRKSAYDILTMDFVVFHQDLKEEEDDDQDQVPETLAKPPTPRKSRLLKTPSMAVLGSVKRHSVQLNFKKFERSLTTCLATMLDNNEINTLLSILEERYGSGSGSGSGGGDNNNNNNSPHKLEVVLVGQLKLILKTEINNPACLGIINDLSNSSSYDNFAYHVELLKEFAPNDSSAGEQQTSNGAAASGGGTAAGNNNKNNTGSTMTTEDNEDNFNIAISLHGKVPTNFPKPTNSKRGGGMSRAKSCAVGI